jgi:hypothetical protein
MYSENSHTQLYYELTRNLHNVADFGEDFRRRDVEGLRRIWNKTRHA